MPEITIDVEVWCSCGEGLCNQADSNGATGIVVEPCEKCQKKAKEEGYDEGFEAAREQYEE